VSGDFLFVNKMAYGLFLRVSCPKADDAPFRHMKCTARISAACLMSTTKRSVRIRRLLRARRWMSWFRHPYRADWSYIKNVLIGLPADKICRFSPMETVSNNGTRSSCVMRCSKKSWTARDAGYASTAVENVGRCRLECCKKTRQDRRSFAHGG